ncbi:CocE/NonD family hydrolase [Fodinicola acaciae]|uniref:CocE/NonD family hydrolase n=1 Tax=Fodinicola acaciae TaxID=2681555 RepID=UPI001C9E593A|nr:CocE/NonD family hydrolase [Fodinicola acaciae]
MRNSLAAAAIDRLLGLPPATTPDVEIHRELTPMPDGVVLVADRLRPRGDKPLPVVIVRTPYGRDALSRQLFGAALARRGFQIFLQSVRGTFGSGGRFQAFHHERDDGIATAEWVRAQPWCDGRIATAGASYLGYTQWSMAPYLEEQPRAVCLGVTASNFDAIHYDGQTVGLQTALTWSAMTATQEGPLGLLRQPLRDRRTNAAMSTIPLNGADIAAIGKQWPYWREVIEHTGPGGDFWSGIDHSGAVERLTAPVSMVTGWWDIFLPWQLADFTALAAAGRSPRITVGPWRHAEFGGLKAMVDDQLSFLAAHLQDDTAGLRRAPVRVYLQGAHRWLDLETWPPAEACDHVLHFLPAGRLGLEPAAASTPDVFRYDPADPTPNVGGPVFAGKPKQQDQSTVESRPDVLTFTGRPLAKPLDLVGTAVAEVYLDTDTGFGDLVVRLCDVDPAGRSRNVCDRIVRLPAGLDGAMRLELWPTAYRFRPGHRVRVQVTAGAFPRYPRNHGFGEPAATATAMRPTTFRVHHDADHPSRVVLPVLAGT